MATKITNTTDDPQIPDYALRRAISWVCEQLGLSPREVRALQIRNRSDGSSSGRIHLRAGRIIISAPYALISPESERALREGQLPLRPHKEYGSQTPGVYRICGEPGLRRRLHAMMGTLAHEIAHRYLYLEGAGKDRAGRPGCNERTTQWHANQVMAAYAAAKSELLTAWIAPPKAPEKPERVPADPRRSRARRDAELLHDWQRKFRLAGTKVAKYKRRVEHATRAGLLP